MNRRGSPVALGLALLVASCAPGVRVDPVRVPPAPAAPEPRPAPAAAPAAPRPERAAVDPQVHADIRRAAAARTVSAKALLERGVAAGAEAERHALLLRALNDYGLAAREWTRLLELDPEAADGAETRYWIADAWHRIVVIEHAVDGTPSPEQLASARRAAVSARAATTGAYRESAAGMVVAIADLALALEHRRHARTHGAEGVEERREVRITGEGEAARVVKDPIPREVQEVVAARDAYLEHVTAADDPGGKRAELAFQAGNFHFLYGHFAEARRRFLTLYDPARCGPSEIGYRAWERLISMANLEQDIPAARALAEARMKSSCNPEGPGPRPPVRHPTHGDAYRRFQMAEKAPPGPERNKLWREAAGAYAAELERAPDHDEAPEYAINGAYAYKQIGAYVEALALYRLFLSRYGSEASLARLAVGDPRATPPRPPDARRYDERRRYAQMAAEQLAAAEVLSFDYRAAAGVYDAIAGNGRFEPRARRDAAHNALILHAHVGERDRALAARGTFARLTPPPGALAEVDWLLARSSLDDWDEHGPDTGPNRAARLAALAEVERFVAHHEARPEAAPLVVQAAHAAARLRRAAGDPQAAAWCARAVRAEGRVRAAAPRGEPPGALHTQLAASCALAEIEASARADFGATFAPRRYRGDPAAIERALRADLARIEGVARRIEDLGRTFGPGPWLVGARATHAGLLDACRAGLAQVATDDRLRLALRGVEEKAARVYLDAVFLAGALRVATPEVVEARRRLAALTRRLGEPAMSALGAGLLDPVSRTPFVYREGMFSSPPGMTGEGGDVLASPLPVVE